MDRKKLRVLEKIGRVGLVTSLTGLIIGGGSSLISDNLENNYTTLADMLKDENLQNSIISKSDYTTKQKQLTDKLMNNEISIDQYHKELEKLTSDENIETLAKISEDKKVQGVVEKYYKENEKYLQKKEGIDTVSSVNLGIGCLSAVATGAVAGIVTHLETKRSHRKYYKKEDKQEEMEK